MNNQPNCTPTKKLNWHPSKNWLLPRRWLHGTPEVWGHQRREAGGERRQGWIGTFLEKRDAQWLPAAVSRHSGATTGATSFIPTSATGRELGMAACSFCFWRRKIMFRPKTNSRNAWVLQQLIKNVSSLGLHYTALSLFPILYLKKRCDYIRVPKSIGFVMNVL